jgi:uncharacterized protein (TIGR00369 family)
MSAMAAPAWTREQLQARLDRARFNAWLGLEVAEWDATQFVLRLHVRPEMLGHATLNALHGGIVAAVIDTACSMAVVARTGESVFTVDMRVDYLRPATAAQYTVRGEIVRLGRTLATADAKLIAPDGKLVATGRALLQQIPDQARNGHPSPG